MANIKGRLFLSFVIVIAFFSPFLAVVAFEGMKREEQSFQDQTAAATAKKDAEDARYEYYLGVAGQQDNLKKSMADAKAQYDQLLKDQPQAIQDNQKTVTQTTVEPVVTQQVVSQPVKTTKSKPKSSSKTKTS